MPSKSPAQHRLMEAVVHNAKFAKNVGIPQSVGKEFVQADKHKNALNKHKFKKKGHNALSKKQ
jgi:hypothetical protein